MTARRLVVHPDGPALAAAAAARLIVAILDAQAARGVAHIVLTGGGIGGHTLEAVAASPAAAAVDWRAVELWWGDERFVPAGDPDRNVTQSLTALRGLEFDPARVHAVAASDEVADAETAAAQYAGALAAGGPPVPVFDVLLLGVGPEGHVASLFPGSEGLADPRSVVAVHQSPKPPPDRVSLTLAAITQADQVWLLASGAEKADAVGALIAGESDPQRLPAAGALGRSATLLLADRAAAAR